MLKGVPLGVHSFLNEQRCHLTDHMLIDSNNFDMKDVGKSNIIMGIKITKSEKGLSLD